MSENRGYHLRKTNSRPDNGRTAEDRRTFRAREKELSALYWADPSQQRNIDAYRAEWRRTGCFASFPLFCDWLAQQKDGTT